MGSSEKSQQQKCEQEYKTVLKDYARMITPSDNATPHCLTMTDAQWYQISKDTDSLRNLAVK